MRGHEEKGENPTIKMSSLYNKRSVNSLEFSKSNFDLSNRFIGSHPVFLILGSGLQFGNLKSLFHTAVSSLLDRKDDHPRVAASATEGDRLVPIPMLNPKSLGVVGFEPTYPEGVRFTVTSNTIYLNLTQHLSTYKTRLCIEECIDIY